jgi:hypothetical protein
MYNNILNNLINRYYRDGGETAPPVKPKVIFDPEEFKRREGLYNDGEKVWNKQYAPKQYANGGVRDGDPPTKKIYKDINDYKIAEAAFVDSTNAYNYGLSFWDNNEIDPRSKVILYKDDPLTGSRHSDPMENHKDNYSIDDYKAQPIGTNRIDLRFVNGTPAYQKPKTQPFYMPAPTGNYDNPDIRPAYRIMMPSGQWMMKEDFINKYDEPTWKRAIGDNSVDAGMSPMAEGGEAEGGETDPFKIDPSKTAAAESTFAEPTAMPSHLLNEGKTIESDPEYFDSHAVYHDNPRYNDLIRKSVYAGTHSYDPKTGQLYKLKTPINMGQGLFSHARERQLMASKEYTILERAAQKKFDDNNTHISPSDFVNKARRREEFQNPNHPIYKNMDPEMAELYQKSGLDANIRAQWDINNPLAAAFALQYAPLPSTGALSTGTKWAKLVPTALEGVNPFLKQALAIGMKYGKKGLLKHFESKPFLNKAQNLIKKGLKWDKKPINKIKQKTFNNLKESYDQEIENIKESTINDLDNIFNFKKKSTRVEGGKKDVGFFKEGGEVITNEEGEMPLPNSSMIPVTQEYWEFINTREEYTPDKLKDIKDPEELWQAKQNFYKDAYDTPLSKDEQVLYNMWYPKAVRDKIVNPMDHGVYDIPGFWQSKDWARKDSRGHGSDTYKKPNHITFSNESKWSSQKGGSPFEGGSWDETGGFKPGKDNFYSNWEIENEFNHEREYWEKKGKKNVVPEHLMYGIPESLTQMEEMPQDNTNLDVNLMPEESFSIE